MSTTSSAGSGASTALQEVLDARLRPWRQAVAALDTDEPDELLQRAAALLVLATRYARHIYSGDAFYLATAEAEDIAEVLGVPRASMQHVSGVLTDLRRRLQQDCPIAKVHAQD